MKKKFIAGLSIAAIAMLSFTTACGNSKNTTGVDTTTPAQTTTQPGPKDTDLSSISVSTSNVKLNYVIGEELDLTGLVVTAKYYDGTTKDVTNYKIDKTDYDSMKKGEYYLKIVYTEGEITKTRSVHISVLSILDTTNYIVGVTATGAKTDYHFEEQFDSTGLVVTAFYKDGTSKELSADNYSIDSSSFDSSKRGNYEIKIKVSEKYTSGTASQTLEVSTCYFANVILTMTKIEKIKGTTDFYQYDKISIADWKIRIYYAEGVTEDKTTGFTTNLDDIIENSNTAIKNKEVTITYKYNGKTCTASEYVTIAAPKASLNAGALATTSVVNQANEVDSVFTLMPGHAVVTDTQSCGTQAFSKSIKLEGAGTKEEVSVKMQIGYAATIQIVASSSEGQQLGIYDAKGDLVSITNCPTTTTRMTFEVEEAGTYYFWATGEISIYYIGIWK